MKNLLLVCTLLISIAGATTAFGIPADYRITEKGKLKVLTTDVKYLRLRVLKLKADAYTYSVRMNMFTKDDDVKSYTRTVRKLSKLLKKLAEMRMAHYDTCTRLKDRIAINKNNSDIPSFIMKKANIAYRTWCGKQREF